MTVSILCLFMVLGGPLALAERHKLSEESRNFTDFYHGHGIALPPVLLEIFAMHLSSPLSLSRLIQTSPLAAIVRGFHNPLPSIPRIFGAKQISTLPLVFAHGMGDSCFNPGMSQITDLAAKRAGVYGVCIPTGDNQLSDTVNGFLMNMDRNVEVFAAKVRGDPKLKNGFHAVGFSQGNSIIRGYIQKYNDPPVNTVIHVHGTIVGVAGFPQCNPDDNIWCKFLASLSGDFVYNMVAQQTFFQANYFRDPKKVDTDYKKYSQLAVWNNEGPGGVNQTLAENFGKVDKFVMVKALADTMVFPNEGEWWGAFAPGDYSKVLPMNQTEWYQKDLFGLKTADKAGKIHFESTPGNHLQFSVENLYSWIDNYILK